MEVFSRELTCSNSRQPKATTRTIKIKSLDLQRESPLSRMPNSERLSTDSFGLEREKAWPHVMNELRAEENPASRVISRPLLAEEQPLEEPG